jgi:hypothetical protein
VTENESNLLYAYQSGAINESLSDVFGEFVQQSNLSEPVALSNRWNLGENLPIYGTLRNMADPTIYGDPDRMGSDKFYTGSGDNGGVHINSGVNNKAAYLMVDGGTFNGKTVTAIGMTKAAKIYYHAQTNLLTSSSDYLDLYIALNQACQNLVGTAAGITSSDCVSVQNATQAVEMNLGAAAVWANYCPAGQAVSSTQFVDGLESGTSNWTFAHSVGAVDWARASGNAYSGTYSLWGADTNVSTDLTASMAGGVTLPANAHLWFAHKFGFELGGSSRYDGGVLEYSNNAGSSWLDAGSLHTEGTGYGGVLVASNALGARSAFSGSSGGYVSSRYNLSSLAGQSVRFRWRVGTDSSVGTTGWYVDDVQIYACATPPGQPTGVTAQSFPGRVQISFTPPFYVGTITSYSATCSASGQTTRIATGASSPLNVYNLAPGVAYACSVSASAGQVTGTSSSTVVATGTRGVDLTPILMLLLD